MHEALRAISFSFFFFSHQRKRLARAGAQFTCFTSKKVQILTPEAQGQTAGERSGKEKPQTPGGTSKKVQILTPEAQGQTAGEKRKRKTANAGVDQGAVLLFRLLDGCVFRRELSY